MAVRAYLAEPWRRATRDVDLVVDPDDTQKLEQVLTELAFRIYPVGPWRRAERRELWVDIAVGKVVDMASFVAYEVDATQAVSIPRGDVVGLPVAPFEDLVAMKLIAHRDKDLLDVLALMRESALDGTAFRRRIAQREVEIPVRRGCLELVAMAELGTAQRLWRERQGSFLHDAELARIIGALRAALGG